jgi:hypothetical protein
MDGVVMDDGTCCFVLSLRVELFERASERASERESERDDYGLDPINYITVTERDSTDM